MFFFIPVPIPVGREPDPESIAAHLLAMSIGVAEVSHTGTCSAFTYRIKMLAHTGNQPQIQVSVSFLV